MNYQEELEHREKLKSTILGRQMNAFANTPLANLDHQDKAMKMAEEIISISDIDAQLEMLKIIRQRMIEYYTMKIME